MLRSFFNHWESVSILGKWKIKAIGRWMGDSGEIILPKAKWWLVASIPIHLKQNLTISFSLVVSTQSFKRGKTGAGNMA